MSPASSTTFWSPPTIASAPPGRTVASFTKKADVPPDLLIFADAVIDEAVVLEIDRPINVAVAPEETVSVTVDGLPDVPRFGVALDLNAMYHPRAIAIDTAKDSASAVLGTSMFDRAVAASATSLRLELFSILSVFKLEKLLSTSVFVRGDPFVLRRVSVDMIGYPLTIKMRSE